MNFVEAHQILKEFSGGEPENFFLCMSGESDPLHIYLKAKAAQQGYAIKLETLQFDTFQQYLFYNRDAQDSPVALLLPWDFCPELNWRTGMPSDLVDYSNLVERIHLTKERIQACDCKKIVYVRAPCPPVFHERRKNQLLSLYIHSVALELNADILDPECFNLEFFLQSGCPISGQHLDRVSTYLYKSTDSYLVGPKKILVTDADNTLWSGVLGEDGISDLQCGLEGTGFVHYIYQSYLMQLKRTGILLALVTKNEKKDLAKVFSSGMMLLSRKDFISVMASYFPKSTQIKLLSEKLNLPLESFVYIDDSEIEIEEVRQSIPNIACIKFSDNADDLIQMFGLFEQLFDRGEVTAEDLGRTELYRQRVKGLKPRDIVGADITNFLLSLDMTLTIFNRSREKRDRAAQLINKTTQFNLNGECRSAKYLDSVVDEGGVLFTAELVDRAGSHGEVIACLIDVAGIVQTFVMSCRVFERGVESAFLQVLLDHGHDVTRMKFKRTNRNEPLQKFVDDVTYIEEEDSTIRLDRASLDRKTTEAVKIFEIVGPV